MMLFKIGFVNRLPRLITELFFVFVIIFVFLVLYKSESNIGEIITLMTIYVIAAFKIIPSSNRIIASIQTLKFNSPAINTLYFEAKNFKILNDIKKQNFAFNENIIINVEN